MLFDQRSTIDFLLLILGKNFDVQQLEKGIDDNPRFKNEWNIDVMMKCIYLMTRK